MQALGVRPRRLDVVEEELRVVGAQERLDLRREPRSDAAGPERHACASLRSRAAASSTSSAAIRMKPSDASCGNVSPVPYDASASA